MTSIILVIVLVYVAASIALGIYAHKKSSDTGEDYFLANRSLSWFHLGMTLFATWMSTFAFIGSPGFYFKKGVAWFLPHGFLVVGSPLLMWFLGRHIWRMGKEKGYVTPGDMLADIFGSKLVKYLVGIVCLLALVPYCLIQLVGIGKILEASTNGVLPFWGGIALATIGIAVYTFFGGVRAIVWTDMLQGVLFGAMMLVGASVAVMAAGGIIPGFSASLETRPEAFTFDPAACGSPITLLIIWSFGYVLLPHMWQRAYMAESAESLTKSIVLGSVLAFALIALPSLLMGMIGIGLFGDVTDSDKFVAHLYSEFLPSALPFLVLATFAAGMSTVDSQLLSAASVVVRDFAKPFSKSALSPKVERLIGRVTTTILLGLLVFLALTPFGQGAIVVLASKGTGIALLLLVPLLAALFWPRANKIGASASLIVGGITMIVLETGVLSIKLPYGFGTPILCFLLQLPAMFFGSFVGTKN